MNKFQVGDVVSWFGAEGIVIKISTCSDFPVRVGFKNPPNNDIECVFCSDGRYYDWHKEPSLILVRREVKRELTKKQVEDAIFNSCSYYDLNREDKEYHKVSLNRFLKELGFEL